MIGMILELFFDNQRSDFSRSVTKAIYYEIISIISISVQIFFSQRHGGSKAIFSLQKETTFIILISVLIFIEKSYPS